jgi:DNA repair exonuclease SbcCD nuclease subunit
MDAGRRMTRFLHAADLHIDSPLQGLSRYDGAPVGRIRSATRDAMENLVSLAVEERVDFVILAGDLYDGDRDDYQTAMFLNKQFDRLRKRGIQVFVVRGNHDAKSKITKTLTVPKNVHVFSEKRAETLRLDELGVALHGRSYAHQAVKDDLSEGYRRAVPQKPDGSPQHCVRDAKKSLFRGNSRGQWEHTRGRQCAPPRRAAMNATRRGSPW